MSYKVITPAGSFNVTFNEDSNEYSGSDTALQFFDNWLRLNEVIGENGTILTMENMSPDNLFLFCQPDGGDITVVEVNNTLDSVYGETMQVSGIEKLKLAKELGALRAAFATETSGLFKLKSAKRIAEIRLILGSKPKSGPVFYDFNATPQFREWMAESFDQGTGPYITAKAMTEAAKANGARIEWGAYDGAVLDSIKGAVSELKKSLRVVNINAPINEIEGAIEQAKLEHDIAESINEALDVLAEYEPDAVLDATGDLSNGYVGNVFKDFELIGRIDMEGDGKAMVFIGATGTERVKTDSGLEFRYSDDDAPLMINALFRVAEPVPVKATREDAAQALKYLRDFMSNSQISAIGTGLRGEEKQFFIDKVMSMKKLIETMPEVYGQDGMGDNAIAYLHYFKGSGDWYITEKDNVEGEPQMQAFGMGYLGYGGELGYISIQKLIQNNVELDLYYTPKTLARIKGKSEPEPNLKDAFIAELNSLKLEVDMNAFNKRLDEIAARIEAAGLMDELDSELNNTADQLTTLLNAAEKG